MLSAVGWIDPHADLPEFAEPRPVPEAPAVSTAARITAVLVDLAVLKVCSIAVLIGVGLPGLVAAVAGVSSGTMNAVIALVLSGLAGLVLFVVLPGLGDGRTVGWRVAGIGYASTSPHSDRRQATLHHLWFLFVPSLLIDPIAVFSLRDVLVAVLCGAALALRPSGDRALGEVLLELDLRDDVVQRVGHVPPRG